MHNGTTSPRRPSHWVQAGDETAKPRESRGESPPRCRERRGLKQAASGVPRYPQTILLPNFLLNLVLWRREQRWWRKPAAACEAKKLAGGIIACGGIIVDVGTLHVPPRCIRRRARAAARTAPQGPSNPASHPCFERPDPCEWFGEALLLVFGDGAESWGWNQALIPAWLETGMQCTFEQVCPAEHRIGCKLGMKPASHGNQGQNQAAPLGDSMGQSAA